MIRRSYWVALGAVGLLSLAGCSGETASKDSATAPATGGNPATTAIDAAKDQASTAASQAGEAAKQAGDVAKDAAGQAANTAGNVVNTAKDALGGAKDGIGGLTSVVTNTKTAVEAGDFAKAKEEFGKFEAAWAPIEDGIKSASPDAYTAIEDNAGKITAALGEASPDKAKVLEMLTSLSSSIPGAK